MSNFIFFFFLNDPATTEIYPLPLHDALPISPGRDEPQVPGHDGGPQVTADVGGRGVRRPAAGGERAVDRKSTRLNSSHANISYAVFCLKKKKKKDTQ